MMCSNAVEEPSSSGLLSFRYKYISSRQFAQLYREGMDLVEETADYLDRAGLALESKRLAPQACIAYTSESIKLTTRLTQLASWLLVRRAIAIGEITASEAHTHRHKVTLAAQSAGRPERFSELPEMFKQLIDESHRLYGRVRRSIRCLAKAIPPRVTAPRPSRRRSSASSWNSPPRNRASATAQSALPLTPALSHWEKGVRLHRTRTSRSLLPLGEGQDEG